MVKLVSSQALFWQITSCYFICGRQNDAGLGRLTCFKGPTVKQPNMLSYRGTRATLPGLHRQAQTIPGQPSYCEAVD